MRTWRSTTSGHSWNWICTSFDTPPTMGCSARFQADSRKVRHSPYNLEDETIETHVHFPINSPSNVLRTTYLDSGSEDFQLDGYIPDRQWAHSLWLEPHGLVPRDDWLAGKLCWDSNITSCWFQQTGRIKNALKLSSCYLRIEFIKLVTWCMIDEWSIPLKMCVISRS